MPEKNTVLGLDIGPNSIGWALIEQEVLARGLQPEPVRLLDTGARVFTEGVDRTPQGTEKSRNAQRREARAARRLHQRRNSRKHGLGVILKEAGLLPVDTEDFDLLMKENPYAFRAKGLDESLGFFEFGRALYHLAQRRGFKSNRKSSKSPKEDGKVQEEAMGLQKEIDGSGCRTVGEFFCKKSTKGSERVRGVHTLRDMYEKEFALLWDAQLTYHKEALTDELREKIHNAIFYQRPFDIRERWGRKLSKLPPGANARRAPELGPCEYERYEKRSPRATWCAQRFRMLQDVNNLTLTDKSTGEERPLDSSERLKLVGMLGAKDEMKFDGVRKLLNLSGSVSFNLEEGGKKNLLGNSTEWNLRQVFKKGYDGLTPEARDEAVRALINEEDEEALLKLADKWGVDEKGKERLLKTNLEGGYLHLSVRALKKLLPHLEDGKSYMDAVEAAGYRRRDQRGVEVSEKLGVKDLPPLANPLVNTALHQVRKVVNAVTRAYGVPSKIRVEMVRDLKNSSKKRKQIFSEQKDNEKRNEDARKRLQEDFEIKDPTRDDIIRYKLWEECERKCPYTGRHIPAGALFSNAIEVEHIIPYSRSLNDSFMNKTLCYAEENRDKLDRTPLEHYGHDEKAWDEILKRIRKFPEQKLKRFYMKEVDEGFLSRQLNDTAYIAREVRAFLEKAAGRDNVQIGKGQATAMLRRLWGMNSILGLHGEKNREDHRHHAVDAVVIALQSPVVIKRLSAASAKGRMIRRESFPPPWQNFRDEVEGKISRIVVSHKTKRKVRGRLHEDTNYGILKMNDGKGQPLYAIRKALSALTAKEVSLIADDRVREIVKEYLRNNGVDPEGGSEKSPEWKRAMSPENLPCLPNRNGPPVTIKKVRLHKPATGMIDMGNRRAVEPGSNHHIVLFEYTDGKKKGRWDGTVVSTFEANRRVRAGVPVIQMEQGDGKRFVMSLSINEMVRFRDKDTQEDRFYRVQKIDGRSGVVAFRLHTAATIANDEERLFKTPNALREIGAVKVSIDPLGRVFEAND